MKSLLLAMIVASSSAEARDYALIDGGVEEAWEALRNMPPDWSWDGQMAFGYGDVPAWRQYNTQYVLMGGRLGFGWHLKNPDHRLGGTLYTSLDGPVPITFAWVIDPGASWDVIVGKVQVGATLGYALSLNANNQLSGWETSVTSGPSVAMRVGYSQPWSRVTRRMHVFAEPRLRIMQGLPSPSVALCVGSGRGI